MEMSDLERRARLFACGSASIAPSPDTDTALGLIRELVEALASRRQSYSFQVENEPTA